MRYIYEIFSQFFLLILTFPHLRSCTVRRDLHQYLPPTSCHRLLNHQRVRKGWKCYEKERKKSNKKRRNKRDKKKQKANQVLNHQRVRK